MNRASSLSGLRACLAGLAGIALSAIAGQPEAAPKLPDAPPAAGLGQRPNPTLAKRSPSGYSLIPLAQHKRLGAVYQMVRATTFMVTAPIAGLVSSSQNLLGYGVVRMPLEAAGDGSMGAVLVAGQFQIPVASVLTPEALTSWSNAGGGPLNTEQNPDIIVTIRNAVETRQLSRDALRSVYTCTVIADVTINGITTESTLPQTVLSFARPGAGDASVKGDQLGIRARWRIFLSNFVTTMPGGRAPVPVDINVDLLLSTTPPEPPSEVSASDPAADAAAQPAPSEPVPAPSPAPESSEPK